MNKDVAILNRLVNELDDSRDFYIHANHRLISSHLKFLVHQFIQTHARIADGLVEQLRADGVQPARMGSQLGRLRARYAKWLAASNPDIDMGYLTQIEGWEARVVHRFAMAVDNVGTARQQLRRHLYELEQAQAQAELLVRQMHSQGVAG